MRNNSINNNKLVYLYWPNPSSLHSPIYSHAHMVNGLLAIPHIMSSYLMSCEHIISASWSSSAPSSACLTSSYLKLVNQRKAMPKRLIPSDLI